MHLHPTLTAILDFPHDPLSSGELASCLGLHAHTINRAIAHDKIESTRINIRGAGGKQRGFITKAAAIKFLWDNTSRDRALLRAAIEESCPALLPFLTGSAAADAEAMQEAIRKASKRPRTKPANLIPFDPSADLFPQVTPATHVA